MKTSGKHRNESLFVVKSENVQHYVLSPSSTRQLINPL